MGDRLVRRVSPIFCAAAWASFQEPVFRVSITTSMILALVMRREFRMPLRYGGTHAEKRFHLKTLTNVLYNELYVAFLEYDARRKQLAEP
jgi:hypothetical protein